MPETPEAQPTDNPYSQPRDHENITMDRDDVLAVAGLLGTVNGALGEIDKRNVGGSNQFVQARKMDPKQALRNIASANGVTAGAPGVPPPPQASVAHTQPHNPHPLLDTQHEPQPNNQYTESLEKRVLALESVVESYKKVEKFRRGISYNINTTKIKGEFKDPATILDLISTEIAKNTKTITLKLVDATTQIKKQE